MLPDSCPSKATLLERQCADSNAHSSARFNVDKAFDMFEKASVRRGVNGKCGNGTK